MSTALMIRPKENPPVRVLEIDGPKRKYVQRGEGSYYLSTSNYPICNESCPFNHDGLDDRLKDWQESHWNIFLNHDGSVEVHACRPTVDEAAEGEMLGRLGSVIVLKFVAKHSVNNARWLARKLTKCDPGKGVVIPEFMLCSFAKIETDIPIFTTLEWPILQR